MYLISVNMTVPFVL